MLLVLITIFLGLSACVVDIKNAIATDMLNNIDRVGAARTSLRDAARTAKLSDHRRHRE